MYAQLVHCGTTPDRRAELRRLIDERLMPALKRDPGFVGTLDLASYGDELLIVLWSSPEQASQRTSDVGHALAGIASIATDGEPRPPVWHVNARV